MKVMSIGESNKIRSSLRDEENLKYEKVIFLDIDGVLNDALYIPGREKPYIDADKVERLKRIVDETGAEIVLTSSWRRALHKYLISSSEDEEERRKLLGDDCRPLQIVEGLADFGIKLREATEIIGSGPSARPVEIREWLMDKRVLKRFVILDDDDFWKWGWLKNYLVLTKEKFSEDNYPEEEYGYRFIRGMTDIHAEKAIKILNEEL